MNLTTNLPAGAVDWASLINTNFSDIQDVANKGLQLVQQLGPTEGWKFDFTGLLGNQVDVYLFTFHLVGTVNGSLSLELRPNSDTTSAASTQGLWSGTGGVGGNIIANKLYVGGTNAASSHVGGAGIFLPRELTSSYRHFVSFASQYEPGLSSYINLRAGWWAGTSQITNLLFADPSGSGSPRIGSSSRMALYKLGI